jgi:hypothetical protein
MSTDTEAPATREGGACCGGASGAADRPAERQPRETARPAPAETSKGCCCRG